MYDNIHSSSLSSRSTLDCDEISLFLHHLLHSSSSSSSCMFDKGKPMLFSSPLPSPPLLVQSLPDSQQPCLSTLLFSDSDCRVRNGTSTTESSAAVDTSGSILSSSGVYLPADVQANGNMSSVGFAGDCDAVTATVKRGKFPADNYDLDDYDCESEEGVEGLEGATKPVPPRGSSKRSRAAEVHNLSEKRRRSRINEKMKALQNLIPNSNKTDKASMLDEAIEYLKQLQLQVQMLSMRNGLSLHPMYLPGLLQQPMQLPRMQMGFDEGNGSPHMNMETGTLPVNQEISRQNAFALSSQCISSQQAIVIPSVTNITNSETSFGLESPIQAHCGPFQLSTASEEIYREDIPQQQLVMNDSSVSLSFDTQASVLEDSNRVEVGVSRRERLEDVLPTDADNQILGHHLHCLQTGQHVPNYAMKIKTPDF